MSRTSFYEGGPPSTGLIVNPAPGAEVIAAAAAAASAAAALAADVNAIAQAAAAANASTLAIAAQAAAATSATGASTSATNAASSAAAAIAAAGTIVPQLPSTDAASVAAVLYKASHAQPLQLTPVDEAMVRASLFQASHKALQFQNPTAWALFFQSTLGSAPQINQFNTAATPYTPVSNVFSALSRVIAAQSGSVGGNAILGASIQDTLGTVTPCFPCGITGYASLITSGAGNAAFGVFARADIAANGFAGSEFDTNNSFADSPNTFPPNLGFSHGGSPNGGVFDNCYAIGLQIVNIGAFKAHSGLRIVSSGGQPFRSGIYLDPNAAGSYAIFADATSTVGAATTALLRNTGAGLHMMLQTAATQTAGNPVIQHQNISISPVTTFQVNQNGDIISNNSTSVSPPSGKLWLANTDGVSTFLNMDSFGPSVFNILTMRAARGTGVAPANLAQNDFIGFIGARPFVNGAYGAYSAAIEFVYTDPNPALGKIGSSIIFQTAANGNTSRSQSMVIQPSGGLSIGNAPDPGQNGLWTYSLNTQIPTLVTTAYSLLNTDTTLFVTGTASVALTLTGQAAGRWLYVNNFAAFTVVSASSNVCPVGSNTPGTAILAATAGKWAILQYDSASGFWRIIANN